MKHLFPALLALLAMVFLTGCPQSKQMPDTPPMVPQPKAAFSLPGAA